MKSTKMLNNDNVKFLCGLIRDVRNIDHLLNDLAISNTQTFSSLKITELAQGVKHDLEAYIQSSINGLTHLKKKIVDTLPSDADAEENILYLVKDASIVDDVVYNQYLLIDGVLELLGRTSTDLTGYYTRDEADTKFALLTDLQTLIDMVGNASDLETTVKDTLVNAINSLKEELDEKEVVKEITWAEYQALSEEEKNNGTRYDIPDMPTGGTDDFLRESDITTVLDSASTNKQVVGAKALYEEFLKGRVIFRDLPQGTDILAWADGLPDENISQVYFCRAYNGVNLPPNMVDGFIMARRITNEKWIGLTWYDIRSTQTFECRKLNDVWGEWKCTNSSVPDVPVTQITSFLDTNMTPTGNACCYSVSNGWCFLTLEIAVNAEKQYSWDTIIDTSYKIPTPKATSPTTKMILSSRIGEILIVAPQWGTLCMFGDAKSSQYFGSISYPVADDWRP